jgi:hypothetical protein
MLGKPMLINDDECDTEYPTLQDDEKRSPGTADSWSDTTAPPLLLPSILVARLMSPIARSLRSLCVTNETLLKFDGHFDSCIRAFPPGLNLGQGPPIRPEHIHPVIHFQNARLMLHRHNLSPSCSPEQRAQAVECCVKTAQESAVILSRCMSSDVSTQPVDMLQRMVSTATAIFCAHIWRSMLFLLFKPLDENFFILLRLASAIGTSRAINISCGRYLSHCLRVLVDKLESSSPIDLEQDEEVVVYLSGDLQSTNNSWAWGSAETGTHLSRRQKHGRTKLSPSEQSLWSDTDSSHVTLWDNRLSSQEEQDWGGWQTVEQGARYLHALQERRQWHGSTSTMSDGVPSEPTPPSLLQQTSFDPTSSTNMPRKDSLPTLVVPSPNSLRTPTLGPGISTTQSSTTKARMTIANII